MDIGIFAKTFVRNSVEACFDAVRGHELHAVQFNYACAGLPSVPQDLDPAVPRAVNAAARERGIAIAAVSGTFNMAHPDRAERERGLRGLMAIIAQCGNLGTGIVTLCTGSRDPGNMWRRHPDNSSRAAYSDLCATLEPALVAAEDHGAVLGVEPEVSNVIDSARKARQLLDDMKTPSLRIVMDGANLFQAGCLARMDAVLDEAFGLLGGDIVLAHAKDLSRDGEAGQQAAGTGVLDYPRYLALLRAAGYDGPLVLHGLDEAEVESAVAFLRGQLAAQD